MPGIGMFVPGIVGAGFVSTDYLSVRDSTFTSTGWNNGTSYLKWYIGANTTNLGNNRGALFSGSTPSLQKVYLLENYLFLTQLILG